MIDLAAEEEAVEAAFSPIDAFARLVARVGGRSACRMVTNAALGLAAAHIAVSAEELIVGSRRRIAASWIGAIPNRAAE